MSSPDRTAFLNQPFINVHDGFGLLTRVYYSNEDFKFYYYINSHDKMIGFRENITDTAKMIADNIAGQCELSFHHPTTFPENKKKKLNKLLGEYDEFDINAKLLVKFLMLLI